MSKAFSFSIKALAILLAVLTVAYLLPMTVFGEMVAESGSVAESSSGAEGGTETALTPEQLIGENYFKPEEEIPADALCEDTEKRESNVKQFLMSDGSYTMAVYAQNVHYMDENGEWQDIDNTLSDSGSVYANKNARIKFSKKIPGNEGIFTLHENNRKITVSLEGAIKKTEGTVTNKVTDHGEHATELQKMTALDNLSASVLYADILENTDIEYLLNGSDIKENIIIKAKGEEYVYVFTLSLNNLIARLEGNEVLLCDGDEHVYTIPAPFMLDASGKRSDSVTYTLTDGGNGKYTLTVTADAEWVNAEERAFPVTVDPAITTTETVAVDIDTATAYHTTVPSAYDWENFEYTVMDNALQVGYALDALYHRGYIAISGLDMHIDNPYIVNAYLNLKQKQYTDWNQYGTGEVDLPLEILVLGCGEWVPGSLCWANQPDLCTGFTPYSHTANGSSDNANCAFEITNYLKHVLDTSNDSLYLSLRTSNDYYGYSSSDYCNRMFYTEVNAGNEPTLTIRYKNKTGMESYWSATSHSAGFAGSGSVNNETGELTFVIDTLSSADSILPAGMSLVYSGAYAGQAWNISNSALPYSQSPAANGFKLGIHETIVPFFIGDTEYLILTDSDGTEHLLVPREDGKYTDVDGMGITLTVHKSHGYSYLDKHGTRYGFHRITGTNRACLVEIRDTDGNRLMIDVTSDHLKPEKIRLCPSGYGTAITETIMQLRIAYNTAGVISSVYNPNTMEAYIFLYGNSVTDNALSQDKSGYLRRILYVKSDETPADNVNSDSYVRPDFTVYGEDYIYTVLASASYEYDSDGRLTAVRDEKQMREIRYTYDEEGRIATVAEYAVNPQNSAVLGQQIGFTYGDGTSAVRSSGTDDVYGNTDDLITHYVFDGEGRTVTAYTTDVDGDTLYGASNVDYVDGNEKAKNKLESSVYSEVTPPQLLVNGNFERDFSSADSGWTTSGDATHKNKAVYSFDVGYAQLKLSDTAAQSYIQQCVTLSKKEYTVTVYLTSQYCEGAELKLQIIPVSGNITEKTIPLNKELEKEGKYTDVFTFTPDEARKYKVRLTLSATEEIHAKNLVEIYSVILTEGIGASAVSHLDNGNFDSGASGWSTDYGTTDEVTTENTEGIHGNVLVLGNSVYERSVKYTLFSIPTAYYTQVPTGNAVKTYTIAAWAKKSDSIKRNCNFRIRVEAIFNRSSSTNATYTNVAIYDFCQTTSEWQYGITSFSIDNVGNRLMEINVYLEYDGTGGTVYFDDIVMLSDAGTVTLYAYDQNGNPSAVRENASTTYYTYTADNRLAFVVDSEGAMTEYRYDDTNERRLDSELNYTFTGVYKEDGDDRIVRSGEIRLESYTVYDYNDYGQRTVTTTYAVDIPIDGIKSELGNIVILHSVGTNDPNVPTEPYNPSVSGEYILTTVTYEDTRSPFIGRVNSETSYLGTTKYFYDETNGRLLAAITYDKEMASGKGLTYTYDVLGNVLTVNPVTAVTETGYTDTTVGNVDYTYNTLNQLESITTATTVYTFTYDIYGNSSEIKMGDDVLASYTYNANNGKLNTLTYGNGVQVEYVYDELDRIKEIWYDDDCSTEDDSELAYEYLYDNSGNLVLLTDHLNSQTVVNYYDMSGKLIDSTTYEGTEVVSGLSISYDDLERISQFTFSVEALSDTALPFTLTEQLYSYKNRTEYRKITTTHGDFDAIMTPTYDALGRTPERQTEIFLDNSDDASLTLTSTYQFATKDNNETSALISQYTSTVAPTGGTSASTTYLYKYDANGNITEIRIPNTTNYLKSNCTCAGLKQCDDVCANGCQCEYNCGCHKTILQYRYAYDNKGQLIREDNRPMNRTFLYSYDDAGNILTNVSYVFSPDVEDFSGLTKKTNRSFTYDASGRISRYKGAIVYDAIGTPVIYRGKELSWQNGRQLASYEDYSFTYNADGIRIGKNNGTVTNEYILNGSQVMRQIISDGTTTYVADYIYHENGTPMAFAFYQQGGTPTYYFYETNLQGDIIAIYDENGSKVVGFRYDAWGSFNTDISNSTVCTDTFLCASLFRYRSYIYDYESNLYYLQSRYYDPETGRFINADGVIANVGTLHGYNTYSYCFNNPINLSDSTGNWPEWMKKAVKYVTKNFVRPIIKAVENTVSKVDVTYSKGINVSGTPSIFSFNLQAGISVDTKGNIAIQGAFSGGITTASSPGGAITEYRTVTNAPSIYYLEGIGYQVGSSVFGGPELPVAIGGDLNIIPDIKNNKLYFGRTSNVGAGIGSPGSEVHVLWGETGTLEPTKINIFDIADKIYERIMAW